MTDLRRRHRWRIAAAAAASACALPAVTGIATGDVSRLQSKLGSAQSQLNSNKQRQQGLAGRVAELNSQVSAMSSQLQLVRSREADARARLAAYETKLAATRAAVVREELHLRHVRHVLSRARVALAAELRGQYEQPQESLVSVLVDSRGMQQLLDTLQFESNVKHHEQSVITVARVARRSAIADAARLVRLQHSDASAASAEQTQTNALAGMDALLSSRQSALNDERAAQNTALAASQASGAQLQSAIATIQRQEQAARAATQAVAEANSGAGTGTGGSAGTGTGGSAGSGAGSSGLSATAGWAIPYPIVLCESGGQNLPPNSAGASGYYQILPSTWQQYGGSGAAAYLASKSEQDAVASRIWNGGAGASNWSCSAITGIT